MKKILLIVIICLLALSVAGGIYQAMSHARWRDAVAEALVRQDLARSRLEELEAEHGDIETELAGYNASISNLDADIAANRPTIDEMTRDMAGQEAEIAALRRGDAGLAGDVAQAELELAELTEKVAGLTKTVESLTD